MSISDDIRKLKVTVTELRDDLRADTLGELQRVVSTLNEIKDLLHDRAEQLTEDVAALAATSAEQREKLAAAVVANK